MDAHQILDPNLSRLRGVASGHILLNDDGTAHCLDRAVKNCNEAVTRRFDEPSIVFCDAGLDEVALDSLDARVRTLFIQLHEAAVAYNIARDDRGAAQRGRPD